MRQNAQIILNDQRWRNLVTGELWTGRQVYLRIIGLDSPDLRRSAARAWMVRTEPGTLYYDQSVPIFKRTR